MHLAQPDFVISRGYYSDCTLGRLFVPKKFSCSTLELPYKGNEPDKSCIEEGLYRYRKAPSPRLRGRIVIWIDGVPGRSSIQIHPANYVFDILGCIAVGDGHVDINKDGMPDVTNSGVTFEKLLESIPDTGWVRIRTATQPGQGVYL